MSHGSPDASARHTLILESAAEVFLRYGWKKTSMDDLARAAGLSRQGLYLHFATKEALFAEAVKHLTAKMLAASRAALAREDKPLPQRILAAFEAVHGPGIGVAQKEHMAELLATAAALVSPSVTELDVALVADVTRALRGTRSVEAWKDAGLSAKELAEHLCTASCGLKHRAQTLAEYRAGMRVAIRVTLREP